MRYRRRGATFIIGFLYTTLLGILPTLSGAREDEMNRQICRGNLQFLGAALILYVRENEGRLPEKLSQLKENVLDLGVFVCPGSGNQVTSDSRIDERTDFEIASEIPREEVAPLIWEKSTGNQLPRLAFYSDGTVRETPRADTGEDNDRHRAASPVRLGKPIEATMLPRNDRDSYWFAISQPGALAVNIDKVPEEMKLAFRVYGAQKSHIPGRRVSDGELPDYGWVSAETRGESVAAVVDLPARGTYYVEVKDQHNKRAEDPYRITLSFEATRDDGEPDNEWQLASPIELGKAVAAAIMPRGDVDWYRIDAESQGVLRVDVSETPENLKMTFRVYDSKRATIRAEAVRGTTGAHGWVSAVHEGGPAAATIKLPGAGTYYLEVKASSGDARSAKSYALNTTFSSAR